jgi:hypothetical protein
VRGSSGATHSFSEPYERDIDFHIRAGNVSRKASILDMSCVEFRDGMTLQEKGDGLRVVFAFDQWFYDDRRMLPQLHSLREAAPHVDLNRFAFVAWVCPERVQFHIEALTFEHLRNTTFKKVAGGL